MIRIRCSAANTVALLRENMKAKPSQVQTEVSKRAQGQSAPVKGAGKYRQGH